MRFHPEVRRDLVTIAGMLADYAGRAVAEAKIAEIEATIRSLARTPHRGSLRHEIAPGLRAIPAGRRGVVVFRVDDAAGTVFILAVTYGGADWIARGRARL